MPWQDARLLGRTAWLSLALLAFTSPGRGASRDNWARDRRKPQPPSACWRARRRRTRTREMPGPSRACRPGPPGAQRFRRRCPPNCPKSDSAEALSPKTGGSETPEEPRPAQEQPVAGEKPVDAAAAGADKPESLTPIPDPKVCAARGDRGHQPQGNDAGREHPGGSAEGVGPAQGDPEAGQRDDASLRRRSVSPRRGELHEDKVVFRSSSASSIVSPRPPLPNNSIWPRSSRCWSPANWARSSARPIRSGASSSRSSPARRRASCRPRSRTSSWSRSLPSRLLAGGDEPGHAAGVQPARPGRGVEASAGQRPATGCGAGCWRPWASTTRRPPPAGRRCAWTPTTPGLATHATLLGQVGRVPEATAAAQKALALSQNRPHVKARALCLLGDLAGPGANPTSSRPCSTTPRPCKQPMP